MEVKVKHFKNQLLGDIFGSLITRDDYIRYEPLPHNTGTNMFKALTGNTAPESDDRIITHTPIDIGRTMYIPPVHMKMYNGNRDICALSMFNMLSGVKDFRNIPILHNGPYFSDLSQETVIANYCSTYSTVAGAFLSILSDSSDSRRFAGLNTIISPVTNGTLPSILLSSILYFNPFIHGVVSTRRKTLSNVKELPQLPGQMGLRKPDLKYRLMNVSNSSYSVLYNSISMFLVPHNGNLLRNVNYRNDERLMNYMSKLGAFLRFIELQTSDYHGRMILTDDTPIIPIIFPVMDARDAANMTSKFLRISVESPGKQFIINRDAVKFIVNPWILYNVSSNSDSYIRRISNMSRFSTFMERQVKKLELSGFNVHITEVYHSNFDYIGGLTEVENIPSGMQMQDKMLSVSTDSLAVAKEFCDKRSGVKLSTSDGIAEAIEFLMAFRDNHIPLIKLTQNERSRL